MKNYILHKRYYTITFILTFFVFVPLAGRAWKVFSNSASTITVYASQPGEQLEAITATATATPTPRAEVKEAVATSTVTPTPTRGTESDSLHETKGVQISPTGQEPNEITVKRQICSVFKSDCDRAIEVARAESNFNPNAKNGHSTATGIFQIIRGTWELYRCEGERTNAMDNIKCAKKIYDRNHGKFNTGGGWEASYHIHHQD